MRGKSAEKGKEHLFKKSIEPDKEEQRRARPRLSLPVRLFANACLSAPFLTEGLHRRRAQLESFEADSLFRGRRSAASNIFGTLSSDAHWRCFSRAFAAAVPTSPIALPLVPRFSFYFHG
jgi:hypothetical protein